MKKVLLFMIAVFSISLASAQFEVQVKVKKPERLWQDAFSWAFLYKQEQSDASDYYFIALRSSNQFDDRIILHLGGKDKAKATIAQLANDLYKKGEIYELVDDRGEAFTMQCEAMNYYRILKQGYAGYGSLSVGWLNKMYSALEE